MFGLESRGEEKDSDRDPGGDKIRAGSAQGLSGWRCEARREGGRERERKRER